MEFNLNINQKAIADNFPTLDIKDAAIIDFLGRFSHSPNIQKRIEGEKVFYWFDYSHISKENPLLRLNDEAIRKRVRHLCELGILEGHEKNRGGKSFFAFGKNYQKTHREVREENPEVELKAQKFGKKIPKGREENPEVGAKVREENPDNHNNHLIIETIEQEEKKGASLFFSSNPENENQTLNPEKNENDLQGGAGGAAGENPLTPPFTPVGTIEPKGATVVRMYDPQLPAVTIVDSIPATTHAPTEFRRVNIGEEIERLKTDELAKETFTLSRKIPSNLYADYVEAFGKEIGGTGETYQNTPAFRKHFFNWSGTRWEIAQKRKTQQNGKGSSLTRAGGDLSVYQEKQIF